MGQKGSAAQGQRARLPGGQRGPEDVVTLEDQAPALVAAGLLVVQRRVEDVVRLAGRLVRRLLILPRACNSSKLLSPRVAGRHLPVSLLLLSFAVARPHNPGTGVSCVRGLARACLARARLPLLVLGLCRSPLRSRAAPGEVQQAQPSLSKQRLHFQDVRMLDVGVQRG